MKKIKVEGENDNNFRWEQLGRAASQRDNSGLYRQRESEREQREYQENLRDLSAEFYESGAGKEKNSHLSGVLEKIIVFSIAMLFFGLPLFFTNLSFQGIVFEKQIYFYLWVLLGLAAWAGKGVITGEMHIRRTPLDIPIIAFWLASFFSAVFSFDRWHSFWGSFSDPSRGFMNLTALVLAFYLILSNFDKKRLAVYLGSFLTSAFLVCFLSLPFISQKSVGGFSLEGIFPSGILGSFSGLGIFISLLFPLLSAGIIGIFQKENLSLLWRFLISLPLFAVLILNLLFLLAFYNFIPWLALFLGITLFMVFLLSRIIHPGSGKMWLPMFVFVAIMVIRLTGQVDIFQTKTSLEVGLGQSVSREIAFNSLHDRWFLGTGPATYLYNFSRYKPEDFNLEKLYNLRFEQPGGIIFEAVPTLGGLGTFFLIVLSLSFLGIGLFYLYRQKEKERIFPLAIFSSALIFLSSALFFHIDGILLIIGSLIMILSVGAFLEDDLDGKKYLSLSLKASPKFALALAFIFMAVSAGVAYLFVYLGKIWLSDVYIKSAFSRDLSESADFSQLAGKSLRLNPQEGNYLVQIGQRYMSLSNLEAAKKEEERDKQKIMDYLNAALIFSRQGRDMLPKDIRSQEALAQIYENTGLYLPGSFQAAAEEYQKALELDPKNPNLVFKIGMIKTAMISDPKMSQEEKKKKIEEARELFQKSVDLKADFAPGYYQLSLVNEALGEKEKAVAEIEKAVRLSPNDNGYILRLAKAYEERGGSEDLKSAEEAYRVVIARTDNDINAHFYLGLLLEKQKRGNEAIEQYQKVRELLPKNSDETEKQIDKMIANVKAGTLNTPESLGLLKKEENVPAEAPSISQENVESGEPPAVPAGE